MAGHRSLMFHMYIVGCMINEYASTSIHVFRLGLSSGLEQATFSTTDVVVHGDLLPWVEVVGSNDSLSISYGGSSLAWRGTAPLLSKLACRAFRRTGELGGGLMEATGPFRVTQSSGSHQTLNLFEGKVA